MRAAVNRGSPAALLVCAFFALACSGLFGTDDSALVAPAEDLLEQGDLPAAYAAYKQLAAANPESVGAAVGLAYTQLLAGDIVGADTTLAGIEPVAGDRVGEIRFRRALVALEAQDLDRVKLLGMASGLPEGKLFAAEVHLVDLESDQAIQLFQELSAVEGVVGETARTYLGLLQSPDQHKASLAEASALWALGDHASACEAVEESLEALAEDDPDKQTLLLLWAGRAVVSGKVSVAKNLLDGLFPPEGQQWRYQSTVAMIKIAEGREAEGMQMFEALRKDPTVPRAGLDDALATACGLTRDPAMAKKLVENVDSPAAARCLLAVGASGNLERVPEGPLRKFLENP
jgi:thioredoxin-like negative regulator of GroEL